MSWAIFAIKLYKATACSADQRYEHSLYLTDATANQPVWEGGGTKIKINWYSVEYKAEQKFARLQLQS
jgi:hypothetical protein